MTDTTDPAILVAIGTDLQRMTLGDLWQADQISADEYTRILNAPLGEWIDFGGGAAERFSICRTEART